MDGTVGYLLVAVIAPAVILASASVLRRRNASPLQHAGPETDQGMLEQPKRAGYTYTSLLIVVLLMVTAGATYATVRLHQSPTRQCTRPAGIGTVVLERFKQQSRNFNSTFNASDNQAVQALFDAGMFYAYAFDHIEASAMFARACEEDGESKCSLCTWGRAYALGPFVNRVMRGQPASSYPTFTCTDQKAAHTVAEQARTQAVNDVSSPLVVELTNAMVQRYLPQVVCNTTTLRNAELEFAQQLAYTAHRHQDASVAALAAEAYMNVYAWKYTLSEEQQRLRKDAQAALDLLNYSLHLEPRQVLALHLKVHLLETQPSRAIHNDGDATLAAGEAAAFALAQLSALPEVPGHLVHMPCHIYIRTGRWAEAVAVRPPLRLTFAVQPGDMIKQKHSDTMLSRLSGNPFLFQHTCGPAPGENMIPADFYARTVRSTQASKASAERDRQDSDACQVAYAPEHNLDMGQFAAMMAGDYEAAQWSAQQLALTPRIHTPGYISQGTNTAAAVEVALYFGRCADVHVSLRRGSRGRSGTRSGPYMAALAAFRDAMCAVQSYYGDSRAHGSSEMSPAEALKLARLVANLEQSASKVSKDEATKPGYGLGLYSAGYHSLAEMYVLVAKAAQACVQQRWDEAVRHLARAAKVETGMGYIEPPRMVMTLQPCLASVLAISGDYVAGHKIVTESLERFPGTVWGKQAATAVDLASAENHENEIHKAAHAACQLIFGSAHLGGGAPGG